MPVRVRSTAANRSLDHDVQDFQALQHRLQQVAVPTAVKAAKDAATAPSPGIHKARYRTFAPDHIV